MKKITVIFAALSLSVFSVLIGISSILGMYQFGKYTEYEGRLEQLEANKEIVLHTTPDNEQIDLSFYFDEEDDLIIEDFQNVKVSGYYIKALNLLRVEEIGETDNLIL